MRIGSLFAGIGGFDLAARWMGWETAWFSEIDPYASAVLQKHWPDVPNHGDITKIDFTQAEPVDMLCGGFPCQDISLAGRGGGIDGERSGLWREYRRAVRELRPRLVVVENVTALLGRGLERVLGDLAEIGYDAEWHCIPAAAVGGVHVRDRAWVVSYPQRDGVQGWSLAASIRQRLWREEQLPRFLLPRLRHEVSDTRGWRMDHGIPSRLDVRRNIGVGNAIDPRNAYVIFQAIQEAEERINAA